MIKSVGFWVVMGIVALGLAFGAIGVWSLIRGTSESEPYELSSACHDVKDFDFHIRNTGPDLDYTFEGEISGDDFKGYSVVEHHMSKETSHTDAVGLNGEIWERIDGKDWEQNEHFSVSVLYGFIDPLYGSFSASIICPGASGVEWADSANLVEPGYYRMHKNDVKWEYWVGDDGILKRTLRTSNFGYADITISGVGEPNVIERPPGV